MRWIIVLVLICIGSLTRADILVPTKTLRANTVLTAQDVMIKRDGRGDSLLDISDVVGMETRVVLYAGRAIRTEDLGAPAIIQRNSVIPLVFRQNGLLISTNGRALDRGALGDVIRVMNISSKATLFGVVRSDGSVDVSQ